MHEHAPRVTISHHYDAFGHILTWQQAGQEHTNPWKYTFAYDNADQLTGASETDVNTGAVVNPYGLRV